MSTKHTVTVCALTGALVLLTGCGSSSSDAKSGTTTSAGTSASNSATTPSSAPATSSSAPAASPSPTVTPATVVQLKKIVLQAADLPRGWKATPPESSSDDSTGQAELMKCIGAKNTDDDQVATVDSSDFHLGDATISSSASSYKSQSSLDSDTALLKSPKLVPCYTKLLKKELGSSLPQGASLGAVSIKFTPGAGSGPANVAGSGAATVGVTVSGQSLKVYINFVYITGPLMELEVDAENLGAPVPAAALQAAVKAVADRAAASS